MKRNGLVVPLRVVGFGKVRRCGVEGVHEQGVVRGGGSNVCSTSAGYFGGGVMN